MSWPTCGREYCGECGCETSHTNGYCDNHAPPKAVGILEKMKLMEQETGLLQKTAKKLALKLFQAGIPHLMAGGFAIKREIWMAHAQARIENS